MFLIKKGVHFHRQNASSPFSRSSARQIAEHLFPSCQNLPNVFISSKEAKRRISLALVRWWFFFLSHWRSCCWYTPSKHATRCQKCCTGKLEGLYMIYGPAKNKLYRTYSTHLFNFMYIKDSLLLWSMKFLFKLKADIYILSLSQGNKSIPSYNRVRRWMCD